jgi:hypothetical protein
MPYEARQSDLSADPQPGHQYVYRPAVDRWAVLGTREDARTFSRTLRRSCGAVSRHIRNASLLDCIASCLVHQRRQCAPDPPHSRGSGSSVNWAQCSCMNPLDNVRLIFSCHRHLTASLTGLGVICSHAPARRGIDSFPSDVERNTGQPRRSRAGRCESASAELDQARQGLEEPVHTAHKQGENAEDRNK